MQHGWQLYLSIIFLLLVLRRGLLSVDTSLGEIIRSLLVLGVVLLVANLLGIVKLD